MCRRHIANAGIAALLCALLSTMPAFAERADRDKPMNLQADHVTVDNRNQTSVFEGNVTLTQGTLAIHGDRVLLKQDAQGFKHGIVYGNPASFHQKNDNDDDYIEGYAERIEYDEKTKLFQMFDRASLKKGDDNVHGDYISYEEDTQVFHVNSGDNNSADADARVRAVIQPKPQQPKMPAASETMPTESNAGISLKMSPQMSAPRL